MAAKESSYPMNGGDGLYSYTKNSSGQRAVTDSAKELINEAIAEKLNIENFSSSNTFRVADLGCSVGPNTFFAMKYILEAVELKYQGQGLDYQIPEFQVFFNDHTLNDFNTLFSSLPHNRRYYAVGVPGSFYSRLFPNASLHFVYSSYAIQWLSKVPKEVVDKSSPAWNKGKIHIANAADEVVKAYSDQYAKDMEHFLHARAQEIVCGGLMVIVVPCCPNGTPVSQASFIMIVDILGSCLMDMANKGIVSEEAVDSFNVPIYPTSPQELEAAIHQNGCFSVEKMESLPPLTALENGTLSRDRACTLHLRATMEGLIKEHFGHDILDELFDSFEKKIEEAYASSILESGKAINLFVLLKRKEIN